MRPPLRALLAASLFLLGACAAHPAPIDRPTPDPDWDAAFARDSGWNGGDIAHAVDLHDHRTLWLFGDSFFGPVHQGRRIPDHARMLRAAVAWHPTPAQGLAPDPKSISFAGPEPFDDLPVVPWATPITPSSHPTPGSGS